jgi:hypothetical protein
MRFNENINNEGDVDCRKNVVRLIISFQRKFKIRKKCEKKEKISF